MVFTLHGGRRLAKRRRAWRMPDSFVDWTALQARRADGEAGACAASAVVAGAIVVAGAAATVDALSGHVAPEPIDGFVFDDHGDELEAASELVDGDPFSAAPPPTVENDSEGIGQ